MTKQAELDILRATVAKLGADSYCGPWLASVLPEIEQDIVSDIDPFPMLPSQALRRGAEIRAGAVAEAAEMVESARVQAKKGLDAAYQEAQRVRERMASELRRMADGIGR